MYGQYRGKETAFWKAQNLLGDRGRKLISQQAFTMLLSGLPDMFDVGYDERALVSAHAGRGTVAAPTPFLPRQIARGALSDPGGLSVVSGPLGLATV
jgi:hypothetical protein